MLYLQCENKSSLGDDTFWTWMEREFVGNHTFDPPHSAGKGDSILRYSTLGPPPLNHARAFSQAQSVALCWELHHEMQRQLGIDYTPTLKKIEACATACSRRVVASHLMVDDYTPFGSVDVIPLGVNIDLFRPLDKTRLREKWGVPAGSRVGFWCGTGHTMKGFDRLVEYAGIHQEIFWVIVWKTRKERVNHTLPSVEFTQVNQTDMAELMNCADFIPTTGRLRPFFLVEWEAMACNLQVVNEWGLEKDFVPGDNPRNQLIEMGWDRRAVKRAWEKYLCLT